jgi:hypothetical protein
MDSERKTYNFGAPPAKGERRGGRAKGTPNKHTEKVRAMHSKDLNEAHAAVKWCLSSKAPLRLQLRAAKEVFHRVYGRPKRAKPEPPPGFDYSTLTNEQREALTSIAKGIREAQQAAEAASDGESPH